MLVLRVSLARARAGALALGALATGAGPTLGACSRPEPITVELPRPLSSGPRPDLFPTASAAPAPAPTPTEPAKPTPFPLTHLASDAPTLGAPCATGDRAFCGTGARVAVTAHRYQFRGPERPACQPLSVAPADFMAGHTTSACVEGDHLYVNRTCVVCRSPSGTAIEGLVSEMTPGQLAFVQEHVGLKGAPLLSAQEWDLAIRSAHSNTMKEKH